MPRYTIQSWIRRDSKVGLVQDGISVHKSRSEADKYAELMKSEGSPSMPHGNPLTVLIKEPEDDLKESTIRLGKKDAVTFMKKYNLR